MTHERIEALEEEKSCLSKDNHALRQSIDRLAPENAVLKERLFQAETNNLVSTAIIASGGGIISYATFTGGIGPRLADLGGGILFAGVFLLIVTNLRRRFRGEKER